MALHLPHLLHLAPLPGNVPLVLEGDLHLLGHGGGQVGALRVEGGQVAVPHPGPPQQVGQPGPAFGGGLPLALQHRVQDRGGGRASALQPLDLPVHRSVFGLHPLISLVADQTGGVTDRAQPLVGVVLPVEQPVLCPRGHHAVGFVGALGHQVVDQHPDVPLVPANDHRRPAQQLQGGVHPRHKALDSGLLIAGGAVELPRPVESGDPDVLQGGVELGGVHAVVLDGVGRPGHLGSLQSGDGVEHLHLHVLGQGGGEALDVELLGVQPHGLDEELVPGLVGEADHLVLDGGAVPGPHPLDDTGEEGGAVQVGPDHGVGALVGVGQVAHRPVLWNLPGLEGERDHRLVAGLDLHFGKIHAPGVDPGRRAGLEPAQAQPQPQQALGQRQGGGQAVGPGIPGHVAHDGPPTQIGTGTHHGGPDLVHRSGGGTHPVHRTGLVGEEVGDLGLLHPQVFLQFQGVLHDLLVLPPVGLGPQGPDGGALAPVQGAVLDAGPVRRPGHLAAQGVQLPDQMALSGAADGGIAGHVTHRVQVDSEAHRFQSQPGGGQGGLDARVPCPDDGDIIASSVVVHGSHPVKFHNRRQRAAPCRPPSSCFFLSRRSDNRASSGWAAP